MSYFRSLFGGQNDNVRENENGAEVVEKLVERVETSTVLEDRRDALKVLRTLAKKMRLPVAMIGMQAYIEILEKEKTNLELVALTLDILVSVVQDEDVEEGADELGERLSEILVRKKQFVASIMSLVDEYEFSIRRNLVLLLTALLRYRGNELQMAIMAEPMGVSKLVDLLHESREAVRNNVVLMLSELSRANTQIQQLLAYENTFQLLFDIIEVEPSERNVIGIVVEDCLYVMLNLLGKNSMNQQLFREASLIQRLTSVLHTFLYGGSEEDDVGWDEWPKQKVANVIFLLQVIRSLVSPLNNPQSNTYAAEKAISQSGMLAELCTVLLSVVGVTTDVLAETIIAVAEVIRGNYANQEYFAGRTLGSSLGNRSALLVLLMTMTAQKQALKLRCAVFYCFLSYLYDNNHGKTKIIDTLLPSASSDSASGPTAGQCLCSAIMSSEGVQVWMGCVCLIHCLIDADHLKQQLLKVHLTIDSSETPTPLIRHLGNLLISLGNRKPQVRAGLLMLLAVWLHNCPLAVTQFLQVEDIVQYLTTQIDECGAEGSEGENRVVHGLLALVLALCLLDGEATDNDKNSLNAIVERRVGNEKIVELLEGISNSEQYVHAAQQPQPKAKTPGDLFLDFQFTKFFKGLEGQITKQLKPDGSSVANGTSEKVVLSFKELVKRQDETIAERDQQLKKLAGEKEVWLKLIIFSNAAPWQAEAQRYMKWAEEWQLFETGKYTNPADAVVEQLTKQVRELEEQLNVGWQAYETLQQQSYAQITQLNEKSQSLEKQVAALSAEKQKSSENEELAAKNKEIEDLLVLLADQDAKISEYRRTLVQLGQTVTDDEEEQDA
ncbi:unnamed protein product [Enterobius vermicularis]|uniref:Uso1_p115_head domain-containing protein n=1 Tax=Enterobius vermicularis TaxID=51028 RepID=A0A0N4V0I8_ENTVE|nr:unnamed protein product [Enterobius vermicularis]